MALHASAAERRAGSLCRRVWRERFRRSRPHPALDQVAPGALLQEPRSGHHRHERDAIAVRIGTARPVSDLAALTMAFNGTAGELNRRIRIRLWTDFPN